MRTRSESYELDDVEKNNRFRPSKILMAKLRALICGLSTGFHNNSTTNS